MLWLTECVQVKYGKVTAGDELGDAKFKMRSECVCKSDNMLTITYCILNDQKLYHYDVYNI